MNIETVWLTKLILSHLITDFILQPKSWIESRNKKHFASDKLYLHGTITALVPLLILGYRYWPVAIIILVTHTLIDGWKSYQRPAAVYFFIDQLLHLLIIGACWYFSFFNWNEIQFTWDQLNKQPSVWKTLCGFVFITTPAGIIIGQLTKKWRDQIENGESLNNAGKWIGVAERTIILILVLNNQYSAISLLVAAKGIIRFNEKDRPEIKTEYLVIGTLMSIVIAIITGLILKV